MDHIPQRYQEDLRASKVAGYECMRLGRKRLDSVCMLLSRLEFQRSRGASLYPVSLPERPDATRYLCRVCSCFVCKLLGGKRRYVHHQLLFPNACV